MTRTLASLAAASFAVVIGACAVAQPAAQPTSQPASGELVIVTREEWGSKPQPIDEAKRHTPRIFTIHHAGTLWKPTDNPLRTVTALQKYGQTQKNWPDLPYHYLIAPDGRVFEGRDWSYQPESNTNYSLDGVMNVELMGNFEEQRVSPQQLRALVQLLTKLSTELNIPIDTIRGHSDAAVNQTTCPGKDFARYIANGSIKRWVGESLAGKTPDIQELPALPGGPTTRIATEIATTQPKG